MRPSKATRIDGARMAPHRRDGAALTKSTTAVTNELLLVSALRSVGAGRQRLPTRRRESHLALLHADAGAGHHLDEAHARRVLPGGHPRARCAPRVHGLAVGAWPGGDPGEQFDEQGGQSEILSSSGGRSVAERGGFEPPVPRGHTRFRVVPFQPGSRTSPATPCVAQDGGSSHRPASGQRVGDRRARKKSCSSVRLSSASTPALIARRWFRRGSAERSTTEPAAPPLGSAQP